MVERVTVRIVDDALKTIGAVQIAEQAVVADDRIRVVGVAQDVAAARGPTAWWRSCRAGSLLASSLAVSRYWLLVIKNAVPISMNSTSMLSTTAATRRAGSAAWRRRCGRDCIGN